MSAQVLSIILTGFVLLAFVVLGAVHSRIHLGSSKRAQPQGPRPANKDTQKVRRHAIYDAEYSEGKSFVLKTAVHSHESHTSAAQDPSTSEASKNKPKYKVAYDCAHELTTIRSGYISVWPTDCTPNTWCFHKCPGGRWINNGWIDVEDTLPLMSDDYLPENEFVYLDIGCKLAEEVQFVLKRFPRAKVVAMEMRQEVARKCEANAKAIASDGQSITVLNQAAATSSTRGAFEVRGDSSSILSAADLEGGERKGTEIDFVTLDSVWRRYLAPNRINLMKLDAEGWDGLILKHGAVELLKERLVDNFIFEYHGTGTGQYWRGELKEYVREFWEMGYNCFHISCAYLFPLTPPELWDDKYEYKGQGNVLCSLPSKGINRLHSNFYGAGGGPGIKNTSKARQTEPAYLSPNEKTDFPTNYSSFVAQLGNLLKNRQCLEYGGKHV